MLSRLILARGSSGRSLLAACCFGLRVKSHLPRSVGSFRVCPMVRRVCYPSAALVHPCHHPHSAEDNRSWKSPFQSQFSATISSTLPKGAFGKAQGFWKVKPYPASEETRGRHREVSQRQPRDQRQDDQDPGPAAQGQQLHVSHHSPWCSTQGRTYHE